MKLKGRMNKGGHYDVEREGKGGWQKLKGRMDKGGHDDMGKCANLKGRWIKWNRKGGWKRWHYDVQIEGGWIRKGIVNGNENGCKSGHYDVN